MQSEYNIVGGILFGLYVEFYRSEITATVGGIDGSLSPFFGFAVSAKVAKTNPFIAEY